MKTNGNASRPRLAPTRARRAILAVMMAVILLALSACGAKQKNIYPAMADAIALPLYDYQNLSKSDRLSTISAMTQIVFISEEDLPMKPAALDALMMDSVGEGGYDGDEPGSAIAVFCVLGDTSPNYYLRTDLDSAMDLSDAITLRVNDLTGQTYSKGVAGMRALIDGLYALDYIDDDAGSTAYFAPMMALKVRAAVEEVLENDYTSSGKIDYDEQGGYLRELCKLLDLDFDEVYDKLWALADGYEDAKAQHEQDLTKQAEADRALAQTLVGVYVSDSGWELSLDEGGTYTLAMMEEMSFSFGGWEVMGGVLLLSDTPASITAEGIYVDDIDLPFTQR